MNLLCKLGFHDWWPEVNNFFPPQIDDMVFRTFWRCRRCRKWGKLIYMDKPFEGIKEITKGEK